MQWGTRFISRFLSTVPRTQFNMLKARKYIVTKRFQGRPKLTDFEIVEQVLPPLKNGEILVKAEYISLDPYLLFANNTVQGGNKVLDDSLPYDQNSYQVGIILESKNSNFPVDTRVVSHQGWKDHYVVDPDAPVSESRNKIRKIPDLKRLPISLAIGAVGMPGATAYVGFHNTRPKAGETVVVSGAAGAVGSLVGQIAKVRGCKVIGFAGSDDKVQWLEKDLGFDKALNYKKEDPLTFLERVAPQGVDIYYDNVGGEISSSVIRNMNIGGRVCVCGSISSYSDPVLPKATILQPTILFKELEIKGFRIPNITYDRWEEAFSEMVKWIKNGQIKTREHVTEGFGNIPRAFIGMLSGENIGKTVVKV